MEAFAPAGLRDRQSMLDALLALLPSLRGTSNYRIWAPATITQFFV